MAERDGKAKKERLRQVAEENRKLLEEANERGISIQELLRERQAEPVDDTDPFYIDSEADRLARRTESRPVRPSRKTWYLNETPLPAPQLDLERLRRQQILAEENQKLLEEANKRGVSIQELLGVQQPEPVIDVEIGPVTQIRPRYPYIDPEADRLARRTESRPVRPRYPYIDPEADRLARRTESRPVRPSRKTWYLNETPLPAPKLDLERLRRQQILDDIASRARLGRTPPPPTFEEELERAAQELEK